MSRRAVPGIALALLLAGALAAAAAAPPETRLQSLVTRYEEHLREARPDLGSLAGLSRCDDRLVPVTEASLEHDAPLLAALADSAAALHRAALAPAAQRTLDTLRARIAREAAPLGDGAWRREPSRYLALVHDAVLESARRPRTTPCERERQALSRLRAVPEVLRAAEVNLGHADAIDVDAETARWDAALLELRSTLPGLFPDCHEGERFADLVEADSLALGAARHFVGLLRTRSRQAPAH